MCDKKHSLGTRAALSAIRWYKQRGGGQALWVECNFEPSCSSYSMLAFERFGFWRGMRLTLSRIRRCNVRDQVGVIQDPVPKVATGERPC